MAYENLILLGSFAALWVSACDSAAPEKAVRKAVTFYASFDETIAGDRGGGELSVSTRSNHPSKKGESIFEKGFDSKAFRIAKAKGVQDGALEGLDVLPNRGRIFFPARGNITYRKGGWSGSVGCGVVVDFITWG